MRQMFFVVLLSLAYYTAAAQPMVINRANAYLDQNNPRAAEGILEEALKEEKSTEIKEKLGDVYGLLQKWDKAAALFRELKNENPNNAAYHYKYGGVLALKARENRIMAITYLGKMRRAFLTAARLDSTNLDARWALIDYYVSVPRLLGGSTKEALKYAEELRMLSPLNGNLAMGYVYEYSDKPEKAKEFYKKALKLSGAFDCGLEGVSKAGTSRNALYYQLGKISAYYNAQNEKGLRCLQKYIKRHTVADGVPLEWAYYRMAQIYRHLNKKSNALKALEKALALKPRFKQAQQEMKHWN